MQKIIKVVFILFLFLFLFLSSLPTSVFSQPQESNQEQTKFGWSSVDDVFSKNEVNKLVKKPMTGPIKIGFSVKEVREVMGIPDRIDEEGYAYYYRQSPIFFNNNWKVQS